MPAAAFPAKIAPDASPAENFSRVQKLAALLVILGPEAAAQVLKGFATSEVEEISGEMARFRNINPDLKDAILRDFSGVAVQAGTGVRGGVEVARATLEKAIGVFKATEILSRVAPNRPNLECVQKISDREPRQIYNLIRQEQPQTIALVISYISPQKAAESLTFFAPEQRDRILERVATLAPTPVDVIEKVVEVLLARRGAAQTQALNQTGGLKTAADVLNSMDKLQGRTLLGSLEERNPELGQAIRRKMFNFEDFAKLESATLQRLLREVDVSALALALKRGASERLKATLLGALSQRAADTVQEEIDFMGSVSLKDIEQAQLLLIDAARRLEAEGVIDLSEAHAKTYALA